MWTPTHVQVTVHRAKNLKAKGKGGTNDVFVTIQLAKEKYQTTVKEKTTNPEWHEECDLELVDGHRSVQLVAYHRNFIGLDEFLGQVSIPLEDYDVYERPRSRWYPLIGKPGRKEKYRGEIEVKLTFIVLSKDGMDKKIKRAGSVKSVADAVSGTLHKKLKLPSRNNSFKSQSSEGPTSNSTQDVEQPTVDKSVVEEPHEGASTNPDTAASQDGQRGLPYVYMGAEQEPKAKLSDSSRKSRSMEALHVSHKRSPLRQMKEVVETDKQDSEEVPQSSKLSDKQKKLLEERARLIQNLQKHSPKTQRPKNLQRTLSDVSSEDGWQMASEVKNTTMGKLADSRDLALSLGSLREEKEPASVSDSLKSDQVSQQEDQSHSSTAPLRAHPTNQETGIVENSGRLSKDDPKRHSLHAGIANKTELTKGMQDGFASLRQKDAELSEEILQQYEHMSKEDLIKMVLTQKEQVKKKDAQIKDMENYIDNLLVRVMETTPKLLQTPQRQMSPLVVRTQSMDSQHTKPTAPARTKGPRVQIEIPMTRSNSQSRKKGGPLIRFKANQSNRR